MICLSASFTYIPLKSVTLSVNLPEASSGQTTWQWKDGKRNSLWTHNIAKVDHLLSRAFLDEAMRKAHPVIILTKVGGLRMRF